MSSVADLLNGDPPPETSVSARGGPMMYTYSPSGDTAVVWTAPRRASGNS